MIAQLVQALLARVLPGIVVLAALAGCASAPVYTGLTPTEAQKLTQSLAGTTRPDDVKVYERYLSIEFQQSFDDRWNCNKSLMIITSLAMDLRYGPDNSFTGVHEADGDCRTKSRARVAGRYDKKFFYLYFPDETTTLVYKYEILRLGMIHSVDGIDIPENTLYFRGAYKYKDGVIFQSTAVDNPRAIHKNRHGMTSSIAFSTEFQPVADDPIAMAPKLRRMYAQNFGAAAAEISRQRLQERRESEETRRQADRAYMAQLAQNSQPAFVTTQQQMQQQLNRQAEINREQLRMAPPPAASATPAPKPSVAQAPAPAQRPATPTVTPGVATMTYAAGTSPGRQAGTTAGGSNSTPPAQTQADANAGTRAAQPPATSTGSKSPSTRSFGTEKNNVAGSKVASASAASEPPKAKREMQYERQNVNVTANWKQCELSRDSAKQWAETTLNSEAINGCRKLGTGWTYEKIYFGGYEQPRACPDGKSWGYLIENATVTCRKAMN